MNNETRKLIKFGTSSLVVSLPKPWIDKNRLKKGDIVFLEEINNIINISTEDDKNPQIRKRIVDIKGMSTRDIKRRLVSLYIANYGIISITGKDLPKKAAEIREIIQGLMALEIIEQTKDKIVAKAYIDYREVKVKNIITKIDIILRGIFGDVMSNSKTIYENIRQRDRDINKLSYLVARILRSALVYPAIAKSIKLDNLEILELYTINRTLEKIGDELKAISKILLTNKLCDKKLSHLKPLFKDAENFFVKSMKAYHKNDYDGAFAIASTRRQISEKIDKFIEKHKKEVCCIEVAERMKGIMRFSNDICRVLFT